MQAQPGFVLPGRPVTVTLTLSNPAQLPVDNLVISATLPAALSYETPLGQGQPTFNPLSRLLLWKIPLTQSHQTRRTMGFIGRIPDEVQASALNLTAAALRLGLEEPALATAQASLLVGQKPVPPPTRPSVKITAGPPAQVRVGVQAEPAEKEVAGPPAHWLAVYVTDADGLAVADGTEVRLELQGGQLDQPVLQTRDGLATVRFQAEAGQTVLVKARAGQVEQQFQTEGGGETGLSPALAPAEETRYGARAAAIVAARNALQRDGDRLVAHNQARRLDFRANRFHFELKGPAGPVQQALTAGRLVTADTLAEQSRAQAEARLAFELTGLRVGPESLLAGQPELAGEENWVHYRSADRLWQMSYQVGDGSVEQYFVFEKGIPTEGDLVIEGLFQTPLKPELVSAEAGIRFSRPGRRAAAAEAETEAVLGYGPAWVSDGAGRQLLAEMELDGRRLRLTVPGEWLARAEFPVVVDPVIGPGELISGLQGEAREPAVASDGTAFVTV
jgi:hypothetical protein